MKNLFKVIKEIWTVDELKKRITYTLLLILVYRIGSYIVLPGIDVEQLNASDLGVDINPRIEQIKVEEPPKRKAGIKVASVEELVQKLKNEAKVI